MSNGLYAPTSLDGTDEILDRLWAQMTKEIETINPQTENWKIQNLPLARVKKIMKAEEFVIQELEKDRLRAEKKSDEEAGKHKLMIAADAPILLSRACELLVRELTCRAWRHTERNKRRTLQRQDIHAAVGESEVYDFLIDIVPRVTPANRVQQQQQPPPQPQHDPSSCAPPSMVEAPTVSSAASTSSDPNLNNLKNQQQQEQGNLQQQTAEALQAQLQLFHQQQQQQQQQHNISSVAEGSSMDSQGEQSQQAENGEWDESLNM
ncbi:hypothetical protein ACA910_014446 [Epithemia clementina (nom. ined.)]